MPQVRPYQRQIEPKAAPAQRRALYPGPPTLQTPIQTQPSTEGAFSQFGKQIAESATGLYAQQTEKRRKALQEEQDRQDEARVMDARRQASALELSLVYDPKTGALAKRGKDAFGVPDEVGEEWNKGVDTIRQDLSNDRQKQMFDHSVFAQSQAVHQKLSVHAFNEIQQYGDAASKASIVNDRSLAVENYNDPRRVQMQIDSIRTTAFNRAKGMGLDADSTKLMIDQETSKTHVDVVNRMLANGEDIKAKVYYETAAHDILPGDDKDRLLKSLEEGSLRGESQRYADKIGATAKTQQDAIDQARAIQDPKLRDQTEDRVIQDWQRKRQAQNDLAEQQAAQSKAMIDQTLKEQLNKIDLVHPKMARDIVPPSIWTSLDESQRASLERYTKQYQEDGPAGRKTNQAIWYSLMQEASNDPKKFASRNLYTSIDKLSDSDFQSLVTLQNSVRKGDKPEADKQLDGIRTNDRIITGTLRKAGIDPEDKENKARVDLLWQKVDEQVAILQRNTNKKASNDDIQGIVDGLLIEEAGKKGSWWNILPGGEPFFDQPGVKRFEIEGRATNPATGEKMIFVNGAWVKE